MPHHIVNYDIDYYLLKFLFIADIFKLKSVNLHLNKLITKMKNRPRNDAIDRYS